MSRNISVLAVVFLFSFAALTGQNGIQVYNSSNSLLPDNTVNAALVANDGSVWAGTEWGVAHFDGSNWTVYQTGNSGLPDNSVRAILETDNGDMWFGMLQGGAARFDGSNWTVFNTTNSVLPSDHVRALGQDPAGNIWLGTTKGLVKLVGSTLSVIEFMSSGGESDHVASLLAYKPDTLWLGMINGGLIHLEDTSKTFYTLANSGIADNTVLGIQRDAGDDLWIATPAACAVRYLNLVFFSYNSFNSPNPSNSASSVVLDRDDNPWFGTYDQGVVHFDGSNWRSINPGNSAAPEERIHSMAYDSANHRLWCGTYSQGIFSMDIDVILAAERGEADFSVWPNPSSGKFNISGIDGKAGEIQLLDLNGHMLAQKQVVRGEKWRMEAQAIPGLYFVRIKTEGNTTIKRIQIH